MSSKLKELGLHKPNSEGFSKYKYLLKELVRKNVKLQYRNSVLGVFWTFLQPLLNMLVLTLIFGTIFGKDDPAMKDYPVYLLCGRLLFDFYSQATKKGMRSIVGNAGIIKKVYIPKYIYPLSNILSTFVTFLISLVVLVFVMAFRILGGADITVSWHVLLAIIPIAILFLLCMGVGFILATLFVFFRDVEYLYDVFCTLLFYFTPIFYMPKQLGLPKIGQLIMQANPLYSITNMFRSFVMFNGKMANGEMFNWNHFWYPLVFSLILIVIGFWAFKKNHNKFILHI